MHLTTICQWKRFGAFVCSFSLFFCFLNRIVIFFFHLDFEVAMAKTVSLTSDCEDETKGVCNVLSVNASCLYSVTQLSVGCQFEIILFYFLSLRGFFFRVETSKGEKHTHQRERETRVFVRRPPSIRFAHG